MPFVNEQAQSDKLGADNRFFIPASQYYTNQPNVIKDEAGSPKTSKILVTTVEKSTVHGFPSIVSSKAYLLNKILWGLSLLVTWAYGIYGVWGLVELYIKYEKTTTISLVPEGT